MITTTFFKFTIGDEIVIIDHSTKEYMWCRGQIVDYLDEDNIIVFVDKLKSRTKVNDRQLMYYDDIKEMESIMGWSSDIDLPHEDLPELPIDKEEYKPCSCEMTSLMRYGCRCIDGRRQLEKEHDSKR